MTAVERQILLNQIAIIEALIPLANMPLAGGGAQSTRQLLRQRYRESAQLIREQSGG